MRCAGQSGRASDVPVLDHGGGDADGDADDGAEGKPIAEFPERPADQRRVIALRFAEEKSIREIAAELGRSEGAVKQLQFRALQNLRARMEGANA